MNEGGLNDLRRYLRPHYDRGVFVRRCAGRERLSLRPAPQRDMKEIIQMKKINKIFNLNHPSDLFLITASSKWIANGHGGSRRPSPLLPGSPVVRTLLAFSWSFSSVSHVLWPQYRPPSLIISAFISTRPMVALTGNLTICIEKLLSCVRWERTVLHNYKWCAAAGPDWRVHVGELGGEWARWWIWCVSVDMKDDHGWNCFSFTCFKVKSFILFPVPSAGFTDKDWNHERTWLFKAIFLSSSSFSIINVIIFDAMTPWYTLHLRVLST